MTADVPVLGYGHSDALSSGEEDARDSITVTSWRKQEGAIKVNMLVGHYNNNASFLTLQVPNPSGFLTL